MIFMVIKISEKEFDEKISVNKKVIIDCYADWCGPCRMVSPIIDELASELVDCEFYKLNVDTAHKITNRYGIMSIPTILIFDNNELKKQLIGFKSREELLNEIKNL